MKFLFLDSLEDCITTEFLEFRVQSMIIQLLNCQYTAYYFKLIHPQSLWLDNRSCHLSIVNMEGKNNLVNEVKIVDTAELIMGYMC